MGQKEAGPEMALEMQDLVVEYHTMDSVVKAVNHLDLHIEKGKTLGLVGETGAGKTTAALSVMRLLPEKAGKVMGGSIHLDGEALLEKKESEMEKIRGNRVSMIFQDPMTSLNPVMSVEKQIAEVIAHHNGGTHKEVMHKAREMLEMVGIQADRGSDYPHQFSGGMKQRVVIAIALACSPFLLIADEPTTALDVTIQAQVLEMMLQLRRQYEMSMLMITHDLGIVAEVCDTVAIMYAGHIVEYGSLQDIFENTLHPYTQGLFDSLPSLKKRQARLMPIQGQMPDPQNLPSGCPFHPRCTKTMECCTRDKPKRHYHSPQHYVECHLYKGNLQALKVEE